MGRWEGNRRVDPELVSQFRPLTAQSMPSSLHSKYVGLERYLDLYAVKGFMRMFCLFFDLSKINLVIGE
jgi:hypothetical protein